jgi:hypothetical protein
MGQVEIARWRKMGIQRRGARHRKANEESAAEGKRCTFHGIKLGNWRPEAMVSNNNHLPTLTLSVSPFSFWVAAQNIVRAAEIVVLS